MFYVGQKVQCVDNNCYSISGQISGLAVGQIYIVRWVGDYRGINDDGCHIRVMGVVRKGRDTPFMARRFKPVVEKKTDIGIFIAMLTKARSKEPV